MCIIVAYDYTTISSADDFFTSGIQTLQHRSKNYVNHKGNYIEK